MTNCRVELLFILYFFNKRWEVKNSKIIKLDFCVGDKQELNVCENTFISEITFNGCKIYVIHGNILQN